MNQPLRYLFKHHSEDPTNFNRKGSSTTDSSKSHLLHLHRLHHSTSYTSNSESKHNTALNTGKFTKMLVECVKEGCLHRLVEEDSTGKPRFENQNFTE